MKTKRLSIFLILILSVLISSCSNSNRDLNPKELIGGLELISPEISGITFNNAIQETETFNHIYYNQIYSGAGVAIGDINNDGLADIFFCGNKVADKLYLNKGDLKFEDISKNSKITRSPGWSWGVTMVDINSDGYLDIYVSRNGESMTPSDRKNKLFINNKNLTFSESAQEYGLADAGFSSQAVFFDMDNDGDLDMYQVNQMPDARLLKRYKNIPKERLKYYTDKFYKNDNGKYIEVSKEVKLINKYTYGLSVSASDLNNDGWVDLYVSNDYDEPDFLYYNNGNGTFRNVINKKTKHISRFSMGTDTGDINNDGAMDIFTLDMAAEDHYRSKTNMKSMNSEEFNNMIAKGDHYQYMYNTLQINNGFGEFSDVAHIAGLSKTDWSWGGLMVDVDNDGFKDIVISNGVKKDVRNNDFLTGLYKELETKSQDFFEMSKKAPSNPLPNYIYKNKNGYEFENVTKKWSFDLPSFSNGISYADLDNDGDLDLVINNIDSPASIYKNKATGNFLKIEFDGPEKNKFGYDTKVVIHHKNKTQTAENTVTRGYFSSIEPKLFFGLGLDKEVEKVEVFWKDGKYKVYKNIEANSTLIANYSDANIKEKVINKTKPLLTQLNSKSLGIYYQHKENKFDEFKEEILLPHNISQNGPYTAVADVNNDGLEDLYIGGSKDNSGVLYLQNNEAKFTISESQPWQKDAASEDSEALFFDADNDKDFDLYIASGGSEYKQGNLNLKDRLYLNDGKGNFLKSKNVIPKIYESSQTVKASDVDNDGDLDLFVGTRLISGKYTHPATSYLLINNNGVFKKQSNKVSNVFENLGMVTDAEFSDIDNDGDEDLMVVGEWMKIQIFENTKGSFKNETKKYGLDNLSRGMWWSITKGDLDNDGDDDFIIGNLGKNNKFKASKEHPFKVYANDFDNNGTNDVVLAKYYKKSGDYVPMRGKECTTQQMPYVSEKFKDYHSFASSKLIDILPKDKIEGAVIYEIENFESVILMNEKGSFKSTPLPIQAQVSPIKDAIIKDLNNDGFKDVIFIGNHYGVEVETVRYDAGYGGLLLGDGKSNFQFVLPNKSGIHIPKDSRNIKSVKSGNKKRFIVSNNSDSLTVLEK